MGKLPIQKRRMRKLAVVSKYSVAGWLVILLLAYGFHAATAPVVNTRNSILWGGYETQSGQGAFDQAEGSWIVPDLGGASSFLIDIWVGIGGRLGSNNLWQVGVRIYDTASGLRYRTWFESVGSSGDPPVFCPDTKAGDSIAAGVWHVAGDPATTWEFQIWVNGAEVTCPSYTYTNSLGQSVVSSVDCKTFPGQCEITNLHYPPDQQTAEWIVESHLPRWNFPNFGTLTFTSVCASITTLTTCNPGNDFNTIRDTIVNGGVRVTVKDWTTNTSFDVQWLKGAAVPPGKPPVKAKPK